MYDTARAFVRDMFRAGPRKLLLREGFRQPGGGYTLHRRRGQLEQRLWLAISSAWGERPGTLRFSAHLVWGHVYLRELGEWPAFPLDPVHGDARDLAVEVGEWLRRELFPALAPEPELVAVARDLEQRPDQRSVECAATVYELLQRADDLARVRRRLAVDFEPPF